MKSEIQKIVAKAEDCLSDSQYNFDGRRYIASVNRSYYCIFDCVRALLFPQGYYPKTHQGAQLKFSQLFIKTKEWDARFGVIIKRVFELRQAGDYDDDMTLSQNDAKIALEYAHEFLTATKKYFNLN